jgi:hypothetical protein
MPGFGNFIRDKGYDADAAIAKYTAVQVGTDDESVAPVTSQGATGFGISQYGVTSDEIDLGKGVSVRIDGTSVWVVGSSVNRGQEVTVGTAGKCEPAATGDYIWGIAMQDGEADDQIAVDLAVVKTIKPA